MSGAALIAARRFQYPGFEQKCGANPCPAREEAATLKYYYAEHREGYERLKAEGKTAWAEIHGQEGFDNFCSRAFLESVLPTLRFSDPEPTVLEYGCGTGPGACFLAERGFDVDAIDLVPSAIALAKEIAARRGLHIHFEVGDVCELPRNGKQYDLIVDSYCLQCIVLDDERQRVFSAVRSRLKRNGYYLVSTAILDQEHEEMIGNRKTKDPNTGIVYTQYGPGLIDLETGIALRRFDDELDEYSDTVSIAGQCYLPHRRHLRPSALTAELEAAGFTVTYRDAHHAGSIACTLGNKLPDKSDADDGSRRGSRSALQRRSWIKTNDPTPCKGIRANGPRRRIATRLCWAS